MLVSSCPGRGLGPGARAVVVCLPVLFGSACAAHRVATTVQDAPPAQHATVRAPATTEQAPINAATQAPGESAEAYVARMRALAAAARPPKPNAAESIETQDAALAAALAVLARTPGAAAHRLVAEEYRRLRVLDLAHSHLTTALRLDPADGAAYDGRARVWRDFGFPGLGLGDAYRAWHLMPASPEAANTLGTIFEALGRLTEAREWYGRALGLEPESPFALNNLCHVETRLGGVGAVATCRRALERSPESRVVHNNLGLAYAAGGDFEQAHAQFSAVADASVAAYNLGIVYLAARRLDLARDAFLEAWRSNPRFSLAAERLRQASAH